MFMFGHGVGLFITSRGAGLEDVGSGLSVGRTWIWSQRVPGLNPTLLLTGGVTFGKSFNLSGVPVLLGVLSRVLAESFQLCYED